MQYKGLYYFLFLYTFVQYKVPREIQDVGINILFYSRMRQHLPG